MRNLILVFVTAVLLAAPQAKSQQLKVAAKGEKALLFNFTGLSTISLTEYQGGIGGKYFLSDGMAVRAMLLFGIDNTTAKGTAGFTDATDNKTAFGIGGGLEYHLHTGSNVSPYLGGAISFTSGSETAKGSVPVGSSAGENKSSSTTFGLGALAGVEYFFNQSISLSAEYQFGISTTSVTSTGNPDQSRLQLGFQTAGLTLAVYF